MHPPTTPPLTHTVATDKHRVRGGVLRQRQRPDGVALQRRVPRRVLLPRWVLLCVVMQLVLECVPSAVLVRKLLCVCSFSYSKIKHSNSKVTLLDVLYHFVLNRLFLCISVI